MSQSTTFMRFASPNERRTISREDLGFYNALTIAAVYESKSKDIDVDSVQSFVQPLKACIEKYPFLSVVVKGKDTEKPAYEAVSSLNLEDHISIIHDDQARANGENETLQKVLSGILDRPWPADIPPWRLVVLPLASMDQTVTRCFIAFSFSHTIGDGMVGLAFHRTFLESWQRPTPNTKEESLIITPNPQSLPPPFDTPERLPISWKFLLGPLIAVYLPKFLVEYLGLSTSSNTVDAGTWTGARIFDAKPNRTRVKILEIEAPLVTQALTASRSHDAKLTATMHQLIARALSKALPNPEITNFISGTAIDMRGSIGTPACTWGLYPSGHYELHPRHPDPNNPTFTDQMWESASNITKNLASAATRLQDQAIGLLRYAPGIRSWTFGKLGQRRDSSFEVSNLLAFDGGDADGGVRIGKMVFAQPANVMSAPLVFGLVSVRGGSLVCSVTWQVGALGMDDGEEEGFVGGVCEGVRGGFEGLS